MEREQMLSPLTEASRELAAARNATGDDRAEHLRRARAAIEAARRVVYSLETRCTALEKAGG